ncbi:NB-ARC domain-containing protein [Actinoallomurus soli]|uniref:NB-ARC domain-containing protein n=1 Tax=Actinoallomurus soli TaxID=2952535 RepID=UPI002092400D|nr:NB-ARC domain-containing protein [Actinoallomurus soli]MCO5967007.1 NB-ARC domain-containing protein [Actinoallomurus soli]
MLKPFELPPPPAHFVGRAAELERLTGILTRDPDRPGPAVVTVHGEGGIGKTTLAVVLGHRVANEFPGGQLFAQLDGPDTPDSPDELQHRINKVLAHFIAALQGPEEEVNFDPAALLVAYRNLTKNRKVLVVLDDVPRAHKVEDLFPAGPRCAVILTSREPPTDPPMAGEGLCELQRLSENESVALLKQLTRREDDVLSELAARCAGLPFALRGVATALAYRPQWEPVTVEHALRVATAHDSRPQPLAASYGLLSEGERIAFRCIASFEQPVFAPWMLAEAAGIEEGDAHVLAARLADARLVERHSTEPSAELLYVAPDPVREYAAHLAEIEDGPERIARTQRVRDAQHKRATVNVREQATSLIEQGRLGAALSKAQTALTIAREGHDNEAEALARVLLAEVSAELGDVAQTERLARRACELANGRVKARALRCLGHAQRRLRDLRGARQSLDSALELVSPSDDPAEYIRVLAERAVVWGMLKEVGSAKEDCAEAERLRHSRDGVQPAIVEWARGVSSYYLDEFAEARTVLAEGHTVASKNGQRLMAAQLHFWSAEVALAQEDYPTAQKIAAESLTSFTEMRHRYGIARCNHVLGRVAVHQNRYGEAALILQEVAEWFRGCGDPWTEGDATRLLANVYAESKKQQQAQVMRGLARSLFMEAGDQERARQLAGGVDSSLRRLMSAIDRSGERE